MGEPLLGGLLGTRVFVLVRRIWSLQSALGLSSQSAGERLILFILRLFRFTFNLISQIVQN